MNPGDFTAINAIRAFGLWLILAAAASAQPYYNSRTFNVPIPLPGGGSLNLSVPVPDNSGGGNLVQGYDLMTYAGLPCRVSTRDLPLQIYSSDYRFLQPTCQAATAWNKVGQQLGGLTFFEVVTVPGTGAIPIQWNSNDMPSQAAGVTTMRKSQSGVRIQGIGISSMNVPEGNLTEVLTHELGHAIGLDHSQDPSDIMYYATHRQRLDSGDDVAISGRDFQMLAWLYNQQRAVPILATR